jgi:hypothetical protein
MIAAGYSRQCNAIGLFLNKLDSASLGQSPLACFFEYGNWPTGSVKAGNYLIRSLTISCLRMALKFDEWIPPEHSTEEPESIESLSTVRWFPECNLQTLMCSRGLAKGSAGLFLSCYYKLEGKRIILNTFNILPNLFNWNNCVTCFGPEIAYRYVC